MDTLLNINPASVIGILSSGAVAPNHALLSAELGLSTPLLFENASTFVGISARGQVLSASVTFQTALQPLRSGADTGTSDLAAVTARAQGLVDAFNAIQADIARIDRLDSLPLGNVSGAGDFARSLDLQALAAYANTDSTLTRLSQVGIEFEVSPLPGGNSELSVDTEKLAAAFADDAAGTAALLGKAADAFSTVTGSFISRSGSQFASLDALLQTDGGLFQALPQPPGFNLGDILSAIPLDSSDWRYTYAAISEYTMVSQLFR
jgi:hypothetical protein